MSLFEKPGLGENIISEVNDQQCPLLMNNNKVTMSIVKVPNNSKSQLIQFVLYRYRYVEVFVFVLSALANNLIVQTTTPILKVLENLYPDYGTTLISMSALIFFIAHPPMAFISNYIIETKGIKFGISVGAVLMIIGTGLRCFVKSGFYFVLIGQFINAIGNCFITNSPAKVAANWFQPRHRPAVTAICTFAVLASSIIGIVIPALFVSSTKNKEDNIFNLMLAEFIMLAIIMIINLVFYRGKPPSPPSLAALEEKEPFKKSLHSLFTNKNYLLLLAFFTLLLGTINAFFATISLLITPFGYESLDCSLIGVFCISFGLFGSIAGATILKKTRKYLGIIFVGSLCGGITFLIELVLLSQETTAYKWSGFIVAGVSGFFAYPVFSTTLEFGCEIAFPVGEASLVGYLMAGSQVFGFVLSLIMTTVLDGEQKSKSYIGAIVYVSFLFASLIPLFFVTQDLRRSKKEIKGTLIKDASVNKDLEQEIKTEYVVDNTTSKIIRKELRTGRTEEDEED